MNVVEWIIIDGSHFVENYCNNCVITQETTCLCERGHFVKVTRALHTREHRRYKLSLPIPLIPPLCQTLFSHVSLLTNTMNLFGFVNFCITTNKQKILYF